MRCFVSLVAGLCFSVLLKAAEPETALPQSPVQHRVETAERRVQAEPKSAQAYNDLAAAYLRWIRDTQDERLYTHLDRALERSLQLSPDNYEAKKLRVSALLGENQFAQAIALAKDLNHRVPDDIAGWSLLVDTNVAVGNYAEAERAAQWILDLRPGSSLGFMKAAGLRELFGDFQGAIEFLDEADRRISQNDADEHAWLLTENARLQLTAGNPQKAEDLLVQARKRFPDSQLALAVLAKVRVAQGRFEEAATLLETRYRNVPSASNLFAWAQALQKSGRVQQATRAFEEFEIKARIEITKGQNANRELIFFYADHKDNVQEALLLAQRETETRHDCSTLDAYGWALYRNGRYSEARTQIDRALAVGVRDPLYFCHAMQIAIKQNDLAASSRFKKELEGLGAGSCDYEKPAQSASAGSPLVDAR